MVATADERGVRPKPRFGADRANRCRNDPHTITVQASNHCTGADETGTLSISIITVALLSERLVG
jgi:hypothetical protein